MIVRALLLAWAARAGGARDNSWASRMDMLPQFRREFMAEVSHQHSYCDECAPHADAPTATGRALTFFFMSRNDHYGGYSSLLRLRASLESAVWGLSRTHLLERDVEIIVVDWNSNASIHCDPLMQGVLRSVPLACADRVSCVQDSVRIIRVPHTVAAQYAPGSGLSETHAFNVAARRARGRAILRLDQDTFIHDPFFEYLSWVRDRDFEPFTKHVAWVSRTSGIANHTVPLVSMGVESFARARGPCERRDTAYALLQPSEVGGFGGPVGVMSFPLATVRAVAGMNERYVHWGGMESEIMDRIQQAGLLDGVVDLRPFMCDNDVFSHMEHDYVTEQRAQNGGNLTFDNADDWGLNDDMLQEHVF